MKTKMEDAGKTERKKTEKGNLLPLAGVTHHNGPTLGVVGSNADALHVFRRLDLQLLVDFILHGQAVAAEAVGHESSERGKNTGKGVEPVPAETTRNVKAVLMPVAGDNILLTTESDQPQMQESRQQKTNLDGSGQDVTVMGETGGERRTIIKRVHGTPLGHLERCLEGVNLLPVEKNFLLEFGKPNIFRHNIKHKVAFEVVGHFLVIHEDFWFEGTGE